MNQQSGAILLDEIVPRLRSVIPHCVKTVGAEDSEELVQDAIANAAKMLESVERQGKTVTPGNIAYYSILHMKWSQKQ